MMEKNWFSLLILHYYFFLTSSSICGQIMKLMNDNDLFIFNNTMIQKTSFLSSNQTYFQRLLLIKTLEFCECSDYRTILIYDDEKTNSITKFIKNIEKVNIILQTLMEPLEGSKPISSRVHDATFQNKDFFRKIDTVAITIIRSYQITGILTALTLIDFWDVTTPIFILNKSDKNCANARGHLRIAWRFYLIAPYYICMNNDEIMMIYTYNPYADVAPHPWAKAEGGDGWYMFKRTFHPESSCENLHFDRTKLLNGMMLNLGVNQTYTNSENYNRIIATIIMKTLNITIVEKRISKLEEIKKLQLDLVLKTINRPFHQYVMTYPVIYSGNYVLSQHRGLLSPLEKIGNFYGIISLIATIIILFITFIVILVSSKNKSLWFAFFEILKLLINSAIDTKIHSLSLKIFFLMVFLYFLIIHATFEGNLAKFLTKPEFQKNVDSFKDLNNSVNVLKIFTGLDRSKSLSELLKNTKFKVKVGASCVENVINDASAVCIDDYSKVLEGAVQYDLHLSKEPIDTIKPLTFLVRPKWPIRQRINNVLMWIEHSGLSKVWSRKFTNRINTYDRKMQERANIPFQPITIDILDFAFILLLVGLCSATICFMIENLLVIHKNKKKPYYKRIKMSRKIKKVNNTVVAVHRLQSRVKQ